MKTTLALVFSVFAFNACCTAKPAPITEPEPRPEPVGGAPNDLATRFDEHPGGAPRVVDFDMTVAQACGIDTSRTYFAFGSAETDTIDEVVAGEVATCMKTGALMSRNVVIIGFADERGPADYNLELGMKRAEAIADTLTKNGIGKDRIFITSYGEIPRARATEADFARDRRATIRVLR